MLKFFPRECGVLIFSTHGRCYTSLLARGQKNVTENVDKAALLADFARTGFAFQPYFEDPTKKYGVSATSPEWLQGVLQRYPNMIMRAYLEEAWGMQDVVILYKKAGHYEPVLGSRETVVRPTNAKTGRWLDRFLRRNG